MQLFGLQYTTPAKQSFLAATYVIFTPLAAWAITKARPLKKDGLAAFIAVLGIALISLNGDLGIQLG
ncbi:MAG: EamA family transporter [[Clostridium] scindens]